MNMDNQELTQFILENLVKAKDPNDLILYICDKEGMSWPQAQALVEKVRSENASNITRKQAPLLTAIALITFTGGLGIIGYEGLTLFRIMGDYSQPGQDPLSLIDLVISAARSTPTLLGVLGLGLVMVLGSLIGMSDVWEAILFPNKP
jgi:hypothetical protein